MAGHVFRGWGWWIIFATVVLASVGVTAISIPGGMLLAAAGFIHGAFFASLGLFFRSCPRPCSPPMARSPWCSCSSCSEPGSSRK